MVAVALRSVLLFVLCLPRAEAGERDASVEPTGLSCTMRTRTSWCLNASTTIRKLPALSAQACCATCQGEGSCTSWVFGGHGGKAPHCSLHAGLALGWAVAPGTGRCEEAGSKAPWPSPPAPSPPPPSPKPAGHGRPNVLLVMTDDLDLELGSEAALPQTQRLLADGGVRMLNSFVSSPRCSPSRAAFTTGRHLHNLMPNLFHENSSKKLKVDGMTMFDPDAVFPTMRRAGYRTAIFGKIQNTQGGWLCMPQNHSEPFDHIETACKVCGDYYRPGATDWVTKQTHGDPHVLGPCCAGAEAAFSNYSEAQYGNRTIRWIKWMSVAEPDTPWFAYIGTTGPHMSEIPAAWHRSAVVAMKDAGVRAPRTPGFNAHAADKYGPLFATQPALDASALAVVDQQYRSRLGTLLSIDDMVAGLVSALRDLRILNHTYIIFTSDHGFHLGQNRIPQGKDLPYDTDIRVPFYVAGPGIAPGTQLHQMVANTDLGPTLADIAGVTPPNIMDGRSLLPLLIVTAADQGSAAATGAYAALGTAHVTRLREEAEGIRNNSAPWRTSYLVEYPDGQAQYFGQVSPWNGTADRDAHSPGTWGPRWCNSTGCITPHSQAQCHPTWPNGTRGTYAFELPSWNWRAMRVINASADFLFVQVDANFSFGAPNEVWSEYYDMKGGARGGGDVWQQHNRWSALGAAQQHALQHELAVLGACGGTRSQRSNCSVGLLS